MTSDGLGEMFKGDSADTCGGKFMLVSMEGQAEGLACADQGARTPIGVSGNFQSFPSLPCGSPAHLYGHAQAGGGQSGLSPW